MPLELAICQAAAHLRRRGTTQFHGYQLAKELREIKDHRLLTAYGTLYRALSRLEEMGCVESRWEDPHIPARENRPGRRLYTLTAAGEAHAITAREQAKVRRARAARRFKPA